jgi:hypothetical protein
MDGQSIARQRLSKHVITEATIEARMFATRCWVMKQQWGRYCQRRDRCYAMIGIHVLTVEAEFSVWSARRLYKQSVACSVGVQFSTSHNEAVQLQVVLS